MQEIADVSWSANYHITAAISKTEKADIWMTTVFSVSFDSVSVIFIFNNCAVSMGVATIFEVQMSNATSLYGVLQKCKV